MEKCLPLGDIFYVEKNQSIVTGYVKDALNHKKRFLFQTTWKPNINYTINYYLNDVTLSQKDTLEGKNPYVSMQYALEYKNKRIFTQT